MLLHSATVGLTDLPAIAQKILALKGDVTLLLLEGDLGAGKTTLVSTLCTELGIEDEFSSPTYAIVNEYTGPIYHFDLYRLESPEEVFDIGFEEYLDSGALCLIEWPGIIESSIEMPFLKIQIEKVDPQKRKISIFKHQQ